MTNRIRGTAGNTLHAVRTAQQRRCLARELSHELSQILIPRNEQGEREQGERFRELDTCISA